jgi:hypothetical protein
MSEYHQVECDVCGLIHRPTDDCNDAVSALFEEAVKIRQDRDRAEARVVELEKALASLIDNIPSDAKQLKLVYAIERAHEVLKR